MINVKSTTRDRMKSLKVSSRGEGQSVYFETSGVRFNGKASHVDDRRLAMNASSMLEPDWSKFSLEELLAADRMATHRLSGGEASWYAVRERIRKAIKQAR